MPLSFSFSKAAPAAREDIRGRYALTVHGGDGGFALPVRACSSSGVSFHRFVPPAKRGVVSVPAPTSWRRFSRALALGNQHETGSLRRCRLRFVSSDPRG